MAPALLMIAALEPRSPAPALTTPGASPAFGFVGRDPAEAAARLRVLLEASGPLPAQVRRLLRTCAELWREHGYSPEWFKVCYATVLLFMGGEFAMTVACVQAFRVSGKGLTRSWRLLQESGNLSSTRLSDLFQQATLAEAERDRRAATEVLLAALARVDPGQLMDAMAGFWTGTLAVVSTLRSQMAYYIGLGANIGRLLFETLRGPVVASAAQRDRTARSGPQGSPSSAGGDLWLDFGLRSLCGLLGIGISLSLARVVSAFHSALQGASTIAHVMFRHLRERRAAQRTSAQRVWSTLTEDKATRDMVSEEEAVKWLLAMIGFLWQVKSRFHVPMVLKLCLAPLYVMETLLGLLALRR